jgi:hypothetical protein
VSAIDAALNTIDRVAADGDLTTQRPSEPLALDALAEPVVLPDGSASTRRGCTASASTSSPARCWTWSNPPTRRSCA